jgi:V/A-type H+-transporting ATPase subunit B
MRAQLSVEGAATRLEGLLLFLRREVKAALNEAVRVMGRDGRPRLGRIVAMDEAFLTLEVMDAVAGLTLPEVRVAFSGRRLGFALGPGLLGRVFNGVGEVIDGGPPIPAVRTYDIDGLAFNPLARQTPRDFIETGISSIDILNSLVRGQKLPVFSAGGLPHDRLALDIAVNGRLRGDGARDFAIVFVGIGIPHDSAAYFRRGLEESGALDRMVLFLNLASDSSVQRLLTPRFALTAAEYLAFEEGRHVLVILSDLTNYCEALREVSTSLGEIPGRKGYPGYLYSDLATLYERAGCLAGRPGSLTQLPILTMPGEDIGHPIPDLTGYITEGQIVLDRELDRAGIYPPVKVLPSLSRLMKDGTGDGYTHRDHPALANQLYAAYAKAVQARVLAAVVGEDGVSEIDQRYLCFGRGFEAEFLAQEGRRTLEESMALGWRLLGCLPRSEMNRLSDRQIGEHLGDDHG